jgi:uncharacterized protein (DUF169 family)
MSTWAEKATSLRTELSLRTEPIAFRRLESLDELDGITNAVRWSQGCTFCQIPFLARVQGMTVAITGDDKMNTRCKRLHALMPTTEQIMETEARGLSGTWMPSFEEAMKQQLDYPLIPPGEAIVVGPLAKAEFEPQVISVYGNPAQIMMVMCGMQKIRYERFQFHFIGEGACVDSIGQCYVSGKASLAIPCYGERAMGQVTDDEIVIALHPDELGVALEGLETLRKIGFKYPIATIGGFFDPAPLLAGFYPDRERNRT